MTAKFDAFKTALLELCKAHKVQISGTLYESVAVWDADASDAGGIWLDDIEDNTDEES